MERHQPSTRKKFGFLEKKKDYVKRAKDYHKKEDQIKKLERKAYFKNDDEFSFKMLSKKMLNGRLRKKETHLSSEELQLLDSQDSRYVGLREGMDKKAAEKMKERLHFLDVDRPNKHTIFVDEDDLPAKSSSSSGPRLAKSKKPNLEDFDVAAHLDTHPALLGRKANRLTTKQLETARLSEPKDQEMQKRYAYKELYHLQERSKRLTKVRQALEMKNHLRGKGKRQQIKADGKDGPAQYKWKYERKK